MKLILGRSNVPANRRQSVELHIGKGTGVEGGSASRMRRKETIGRRGGRIRHNLVLKKK